MGYKKSKNLKDRIVNKTMTVLRKKAHSVDHKRVLKTTATLTELNF